MNNIDSHSYVPWTFAFRLRRDTSSPNHRQFSEQPVWLHVEPKKQFLNWNTLANVENREEKKFARNTWTLKFLNNFLQRNTYEGLNYNSKSVFLFTSVDPFTLFFARLRKTGDLAAWLKFDILLYFWKYM